MSSGSGGGRIGYVMSWYPAVTETFILHEMLELRRLGLELEVYPLFGASGDVRQPGAEALAPLVHYHRPLSVAVAAAQLFWLRRRPAAYLRAWWRALAGNARSPGFFLRALVVVPLAALVARRMSERGVRHVHAHWATHPALAAYVVQALTGASYSFTAHAHDLYVERAMLGEKIARARFVVTISRYNRALLERLYGPAAAAKTAVIRCGVDPQLFRPAPPRAADGHLRLACVAGLRDYKGHRWLVDACALLRRRGVPLSCVLVGDGPERAAIEARIAEAGLGDALSLAGNQPQDRIRAILQSSDAVVLPSVTTADGMMDGIPVALMEAMALGVPVVSTRISGIPELVVDGRTGLLAPEKDAVALADALERLHRDRALARRLGEEGRRHVLARFDLRRNAARLHELLSRALAGDGQAPSVSRKKRRQFVQATFSTTSGDRRRASASTSLGTSVTSRTPLGSGTIPSKSDPNATAS
jgi:glycosyltransferase involved in cell wall biosynthesis